MLAKGPTRVRKTYRRDVGPSRVIFRLGETTRRVLQLVAVLPGLEIPLRRIGVFSNRSLVRIIFVPSLKQHNGVFLGLTSLIEVAGNLNRHIRLCYNNRVLRKTYLFIALTFINIIVIALFTKTYNINNKLIN